MKIQSQWFISFFIITILPKLLKIVKFQIVKIISGFLNFVEILKVYYFLNFILHLRIEWKSLGEMKTYNYPEISIWLGLIDDDPARIANTFIRLKVIINFQLEDRLLNSRRARWIRLSHSSHFKVSSRIKCADFNWILESGHTLGDVWPSLNQDLNALLRIQVHHHLMQLHFRYSTDIFLQILYHNFQLFNSMRRSRRRGQARDSRSAEETAADPGTPPPSYRDVTQSPPPYSPKELPL